MATDYFSDNELFVSNQPLPSPSDTPYHSLSPRTSQYGTPSTDMPSSPAPFPPDPAENSEDVSILDPRRFTPTLHASLVSEILNLRRELDAKYKSIEELETSLHKSRAENDALTSQLSANAKETRAVKRQLQQFESGTLSALEALAGERDKAKDANDDLKAKLEALQKKLRSQEDDSTRVHDMWAREKEAWAGEKRLLERRVHVSESRLKMLFEELALRETIQEGAESQSEGEDMTRDSGVGHESDTASIRSSPQRRPSTRIARHSRNLSNGSYRSIGRGYRMSLMSGTGSEGHGRSNGLSLADELIFDEEEEDLDGLELDSDDFPENEMRARRALESRQSMRQDEKAKRILGLSLENQATNTELPSSSQPDSPGINRMATATSMTITAHDAHLIFPPTKPIYVDRGVQPSPPPSPARPESSQSLSSFAPGKSTDRLSLSMEVEANQSRKRISVVPSCPESEQLQATPPSSTGVSAAKPEERPLSPPATPKVVEPLAQPVSQRTEPPDVTSVSTQTEPEPLPEIPLRSPRRAPPPVPITVPSIAIHAPTSAPPSPKDPVLPPGTKSVATQTSGDLRQDVRSVGIQTDPIRVDKRLIKLPPHLLPSAISSRPGTPEVRQGAKPAASTSNKEPQLPRSQLKSTEKETTMISTRQDLMALLEDAGDKKIEDRYPGNNDNGPLARGTETVLSRPFRTSSLFAGFDGPSSDEEDNTADVNEDDFRLPHHPSSMLSSRNVKSGRIFANPPTPVPEDKEVDSTCRPSEDSLGSGKYSSDRGSFDRPSRVGKHARGGPVRQPSIRRSAMIQNGTAAHVRSRSPSLTSSASSQLVVKPPFPVPTRSSSRKTPLSKSEGSQSPTPRGSGPLPGRRPYGMRPHQRKDSLRKVRSAAVIQRGGRTRSRSPPLPATPVIPPSPPPPPLPMDSVTGHRFGHRPQLSTQTYHTASNSVGSGSYQASVVDSIAATMVGEWMWKYVRKRKAFGGPESPVDVRSGDDGSALNGNGVRHKRWVWISPYERSVLWSSKQPTTSSALIGKGGRKRK
ncbi:uncharacterized protein EI97DRAFT_140417 [Westerdykella ornata]|uniref:Pleckstrin homology domain-containing protein n=1 Tax=Westerdykella ornata TaxID=318751 RepID=A0A6A6JBI0_WESOR|nr:uncharacterized protein EI97DRAFT_140417 [Westerdykella ornata]KAF2273970.1 hypothetical protein EI97DRAFT_140417 [Westerdykella ornata]